MEDTAKTRRDRAIARFCEGFTTEQLEATTLRELFDAVDTVLNDPIMEDEKFPGMIVGVARYDDLEQAMRSLGEENYVRETNLLHRLFCRRKIWGSDKRRANTV